MKTNISRTDQRNIPAKIHFSGTGKRISKVITFEKLLWIGSPLLIIIIWEVITRAGLIPSFILPAPSDIFRSLYRLFASGELLPHIGMSLFRAMVGFIAGSAAGILLGIMMAWSRLTGIIADIPFNVLRSIPKAALVPVFIVWFGIGELPKVLLVALTSFIMCTINTLSGARSADITLVKAARSLGAKDRDILREVVLPSAMPSIFAALRLSIVVSLVLLVIIEMTAATYGLGAFIMSSQQLFYVDDMFAGIFTLAALAYTADLAVRRISERALRWHKGIVATEV